MENLNINIRRLANLMAEEIQLRYGIEAIENVVSKIESHILADNSKDRFEKFAQLLRTKIHNDEWQKIIEKITIHEGYFHRNMNILNSIASVVEQVIKNNKSIRIWSIPCSTGEEAYDLAFIAIQNLYKIHYGTEVFNEQMMEKLDLSNLMIYATDISEICLRKAKSAQYDLSAMGALRQIDPIKKKYFFQSKGNIFEVKPFVKRIVKFAVANAMDKPQVNDFDIIVCRNMLIYFNNDQKKICQENLSQALAPNGFLFFGSVDPFLLNLKDFKQYSDGQSIWYQKKMLGD